MTIAVLVAMPEEMKRLVPTGEWRRDDLDGFPAFRGRIDGCDVVFIRTGMGGARATAAADIAARLAPSLLVSAGFGGAVSPLLRAGEGVVGRRFLAPSPAGMREVCPPLPALAGWLAELRPATILTVQGIVPKERLARLCPEESMPAVVDMETFAVAEVAAAAGIPLLAVRAVSDPAQEELLFSLEEITTGGTDVSLAKVLLLLLRRPRVLPQLLRLGRHSALAGKTLSRVVEEAVRLAAAQRPEER